MLVLLSRAAGTRVVASNPAREGWRIGRGGLDGTRVRIDVAPASERRVGKCPDQQWTKGWGDLVVVLKRHVQRDSADMVPVVEEPPARVNHVHDRPHPPAPVGKARVQRAVVHQHAVPALP